METNQLLKTSLNELRNAIRGSNMNKETETNLLAKVDGIIAYVSNSSVQDPPPAKVSAKTKK